MNLECSYCRCVITQPGNFCPTCGGKISYIDIETCIIKYFKEGYKYENILKFLDKHCGYKMSMRTLKRYLKRFNLKRRGVLDQDTYEKAVFVICNELRGPASLLGYRGMWHNLRMSHGMFVSRDVVMRLLRTLDPDGVAVRSSRKLKRRTYHSLGPNYCWHMDGYDKLKPFGFPIHGCIDGFSRKMLWLKYVRSNNNPFVIADLYLSVVADIEAVPFKIRTDCGTENGIVAAMQAFFRRDDSNEHGGIRSHIYGSSHFNQRIESWWSVYRRGQSSFIIDFFKELVDSNVYNPDEPMQQACSRYCFGGILQIELDKFREHWNTHFIRKSVHCEYNGRPNEMYYFPNLPFVNKAMPVMQNDLDEMNNYIYAWLDDSSNDEIANLYSEYFEYVSSTLGLQACNDWQSSREVFLTLLNYVTE